MEDILKRLAYSSPNESSHELQCRCFDAAEEISRLRTLLDAVQVPVRNAMRYLWLREKMFCNETGYLDVAEIPCNWHDPNNTEIDYTIDTAMTLNVGFGGLVTTGDLDEKRR